MSLAVLKYDFCLQSSQMIVLFVPSLQLAWIVNRGCSVVLISAYLFPGDCHHLCIPFIVLIVVTIPPR